MWAIFKVYWICHNDASVLCFEFIFWLQGMCDLSSLAKDGIHALTLEGKVLTTGPPRKSLKT